jgi:hypothetical protein
MILGRSIKRLPTRQLDCSMSVVIDSQGYPMYNRIDVPEVSVLLTLRIKQIVGFESVRLII